MEPEPTGLNPGIRLSLSLDMPWLSLCFCHVDIALLLISVSRFIYIYTKIYYTKKLTASSIILMMHILRWFSS